MHLLRADTCVGPKTCGNCMASEGHEEQDMQTFADWGAEYVKVDSCSRNCTVAAGTSGNASTCGRELWSRYTSAIAKTGKPMVYSIIGNCDPADGEQPWKWGAEVANSWRTNIDAQVGWQAVPYLIDCQRRMSGNGTWCFANGSSVCVGGMPQCYQGHLQMLPGDGGVPCKCSGGHRPGACLEPASVPLGGPQQFAGNDGGLGGHWNGRLLLLLLLLSIAHHARPLLPLFTLFSNTFASFADGTWIWMYGCANVVRAQTWTCS